MHNIFLSTKVYARTRITKRPLFPAEAGNMQQIMLESEKFKEIAFYSGKNKTVQANGNELLKTISLANRYERRRVNWRKRQRERTARSE